MKVESRVLHRGTPIDFGVLSEYHLRFLEIIVEKFNRQDSFV